MYIDQRRQVSVICQPIDTSIVSWRLEKYKCLPRQAWPSQFSKVYVDRMSLFHHDELSGKIASNHQKGGEINASKIFTYSIWTMIQPYGNVILPDRGSSQHWDHSKGWNLLDEADSFQAVNWLASSSVCATPRVRRTSLNQKFV